MSSRQWYLQSELPALRVSGDGLPVLSRRYCCHSAVGVQLGSFVFHRGGQTSRGSHAVAATPCLDNLSYILSGLDTAAIPACTALFTILAAPIVAPGVTQSVATQKTESGINKTTFTRLKYFKPSRASWQVSWRVSRRVSCLPMMRLVR